jgi:hypothetical protein
MRAKTYDEATAYREGWSDRMGGFGLNFLSLYRGGCSINDYERGYLDAGHSRAESIWDGSVPPGGFICAVCAIPTESEPCPDHQSTTEDQAMSQFTEHDPAAITAWCADNGIDANRVPTGELGAYVMPSGIVTALYRYLSLNDKGRPHLRQPTDLGLAREEWQTKPVCCVPTRTGHHNPSCASHDRRSKP